MTFSARDKEDIVREVLQNLPEYSMSLTCTKWKYKECSYTFHDDEDGTTHKLELADALRGLDLLLASNLDCVPDTTDVEEWCCHADADTIDALIQLSLFDELVYG
jgi:hypothetical protein